MNNFFFKKENFVLDKDFTFSLLKKFDEIFMSKKYKKNLENIREIDQNNICNEPLFKKTLDIIYEKFQLITSFNDLEFSKLWLVYSKSNDTNKNILPYVPHIDKKRFLKAMVYLEDISVTEGPIHLGKVDKNYNIEKKRKKLPNDYKIKGLNIIDKKYLYKDLEPMEGKAGDVIFFDTNTPHKAGIIKEGNSRKILRFDFERPSFNSHFNFIDKYLKNIY